MSTSKITSGIDLIISGLQQIKEAMGSVSVDIQAPVMTINEDPVVPATATQITKAVVSDEKPAKEEPVVEAPVVEEIPVVEEETEETDFHSFFNELELDALKEIGKQLGMSLRGRLSKETLIDKLLATDLDELVKALEVLGYYEEQTEEVAEEPVVEEVAEEPVVEEEAEEELTPEQEYGLDDWTNEEIADLLTQHSLSTKGKRQALVDRVIKAIEDGTIELYGDDEEAEEEVEESDEEEVFEPSPERLKAEAKIASDIEAKHKSGKLRDSVIKKFLNQYYEGDENCADCKGCSKEEILACYIEINKSFVDDEGVVHSNEEPYIRDNAYYCCGKETSETEEGNLCCEVCGNEYEAE